MGAAKLVISLLPNEGGLRWVGGLLPSKFKSTFDGLVTSYKKQMLLALKGDEERAGRALTSIFKDMLTAYSGQIIGTPFEFPSHHLAIREPFDYYQMANAYIGSLIEFDRSILRYPERWTKVQEQLAAGDNVIMLNHQSEGDAVHPAAHRGFAPGLGDGDVRGGRPSRDRLAVQALLHGQEPALRALKKHMDDDPSLKSAKMKQNLNTVKEMQRFSRRAGRSSVAPAGAATGARDGTITPDNWDPAAVEMMRKLGTKKGAAKTHSTPSRWPPTTSCPRPRPRKSPSARSAW